MKALRSAFLAPALAAAVALSAAGPVSATPLSGAAAGSGLVAQADDLSSTIQVRSRRSARVAAGIVGGLIVGGLIASHYRHHYPYYGYSYGSYPYYPYRAYPAYPVDAAIAYCMRRFRSYDPYSMTYLGYDGRRHRCP
ncbi:MAG: BA14K family protein [Bradyrhizobiaceae bacterium]|nr:BA14K family protein [Bradyrhizobiaceae bacterium]